jgi:hypothetical protein
MTMSKQDVVFLVLLVGLWFLWRIAEHLKAIRESLASLADIAEATRATAGDARYLSAIMRSTDNTETLLKRAVKKQWGSAINLE